MLNSSFASSPAILITPDMVIDAFQKGKAASIDQISAEHFIFGPQDRLAGILAPLFTSMIKIHYVPPIFSTSFVIPIPKSRQGTL